MDPKIRALRRGKVFTGSQEVYHNYDYLFDKRNSKHCREYLPTPSLYMISICFRYRMGGGGPNPQLHQPRLPAGKSNSRSKLESPTRKSNSKVQLESPTRNPNSVPSLSHTETDKNRKKDRHTDIDRHTDRQTDIDGQITKHNFSFLLPDVKD